VADYPEVKKGDSLPNSENTRLCGWENIAAFLDRGIRTVRRWEKDAALPVHRLFQGRRCPVYAYRNEIAAWVTDRQEQSSLPPHLTSKSGPDGEPHAAAPRDVLPGWKQIAIFLGCSVRTAQRREQELGLPVRRLESNARRMPYALRSELVLWLKEFRIPAGSTREGLLGPRSLLELQTMIDGWSACIAVLNDTGTIVAVNRAWRVSTHAHAVGNQDCGVGKDYINVCRSLSKAKTGPTPAATIGVTELLTGARQSLQLSYHANASSEKRLFLLQSASFDFQGRICHVLIHSDVTGLMGD
jgi:hypothetical protein